MNTECKLCGRDVKSLISLRVHLSRGHECNSEKLKEYYDKYIKEDKEGICVVCGDMTAYQGFKKGYGKCCSYKCSGELRKKSKKIGNTKCEMCEEVYDGIRGLANHVASIHKGLGVEGYYIKYMLRDGEGVCPVCKNKTPFISIAKGYQTYCSIPCCKKSEEYKEKMSKIARNRDRSDLMGDKNPAKRKEVREKISKSKLGNKITKGYKFSEGQRKNVSIAIKKSWEGNTERKLGLRDTWLNPKNYKQGKYYSEKNNREFHYHSSYELEAFKILDKDDEVVEYVVESLAIPYEFEGEVKHYIPDLVVVKRGGSIQIIEVKPERMIQVDKRNSCKFESAREYARNNDMEFRIWTEKELGGIIE